MSSVADICNLALGRIGISRRIANIASTEQNEAIQCNRFYAHCRDEVLEAYPWPFANRYDELTLLETADDQQWAGDWLYRYNYPANCLRIIALVSEGRESKLPYELVSDDDDVLSILTNIPDAGIKFTAEFEDTEKFSAAFVSALAWKLGSEIAMPLSATDQKMLNAAAMYQRALSKASANAGNEVVRSKGDGESSFTRARG